MLPQQKARSLNSASFPNLSRRRITSSSSSFSSCDDASSYDAFSSSSSCHLSSSSQHWPKPRSQRCQLKEPKRRPRFLRRSSWVVLSESEAITIIVHVVRFRRGNSSRATHMGVKHEFVMMGRPDEFSCRLAQQKNLRRFRRWLPEQAG